MARARKTIEPIFDAVLIDEAQDLPQEFFELIALFTRMPHRIAFAYDELQQLNAASVPSVEDLFGRNEVGQPRLRLHSGSHARTDVVLPVCYRNPPWTLTVAHALGFGIYREGGLVQHFDKASLWKEVGYRVNAGQLEDGQQVALSRDPDSFPRFFAEQLTPEDAVQFQAFAADNEQLAWVAQNIRENLERDELDADDILIVLPNTYTAKRRAVELVRVLAQHGISAHHVGATSSQDLMFKEGSVAITHIYRAKGNEAAMVYVIDAEYAVLDQRWASATGLASRRNVLFTAITRAKAWVRVSGVGAEMNALLAEFQRVVSEDFQLRFKIPTEEERKHLRQLHRDRSEAENARRREAIRTVETALEALDRGDIEMDELPEDMKRRLERLARLPKMSE
ncbi:DEAD/DEAH box helicase [Archangium lansingense]|uniref:DNA 3'-5' helicase II n=1 Tax=Archangium lansingense TaxID=2995310 RepID=A0ABT3ZY41_9BACT|nr:ATP-binding domain-containing protein [Archangium lansinium]MCY1074328.1 ATP-binding domain-containing protein [Archangium lansinium]